ncbi:hypothetical protein RRF57_007538 [Xylaria bambusicola]|uniref:Uncharacterized protein n=1 Tax=Xylaria bambusicola TaxID=326684 RepID=A0AAN7UQN3_9PEZI
MAVWGGMRSPLFSDTGSPNPTELTLIASLTSSNVYHLASSSSGSFPRWIFSPFGAAWPIAPIIRLAGYGQGWELWITTLAT